MVEISTKRAAILITVFAGVKATVRGQMKSPSVVVVMGGGVCDPSLGRRVSIRAAYGVLEVQSTISR